MKQVLALLLFSLIIINLSAQTDIIRVINDDNKVIEIITSEQSDTARIRIGQRTLDVVNDQNKNYGHKQGSTPKKFNPHWAGVEVGVNMFHSTDYSLYGGDEFFDLVPQKSLTWNLNFTEWAFRNGQNNFGLVTGLGLSFSDYTFDQHITIKKHDSNGMVTPIDIDANGLKKSKLTVTYLTIPLMLEVKTPLKSGSSHLYFAGGVIGGLNIGSHTKYKYKYDSNKVKEKYHSNFNLSTFKYELTGRIGFGDLCVFVNYSLSPLFNDGKGPELYPLMIGISFPNIEF